MDMDDEDENEVPIPPPPLPPPPPHALNITVAQHSSTDLVFFDAVKRVIKSFLMVIVVGIGSGSGCVQANRQNHSKRATGIMFGINTVRVRYLLGETKHQKSPPSPSTTAIFRRST
ncbi:MAG: hypothetical protein ABUS47_13775 [Steroidobacter sp.]